MAIVFSDNKNNEKKNYYLFVSVIKAYMCASPPNTQNAFVYLTHTKSAVIEQMNEIITQK